MKLGPNMKRLIIARSAQITVEKSRTKDFYGVLDRLVSRGFVEDAAEGEEWARAAIKALRLAAEPNPCKGRSDEDIAATIMELVDARNQDR